MSARTALPGLGVGITGLVAGVAGAALGEASLGAAAGVLALVAGLVAAGTARRLDDNAAAQLLIENEVKALRADSAVGTSPPASAPGGAVGTGDDDRPVPVGGRTGPGQAGGTPGRSDTTDLTLDRSTDDVGSIRDDRTGPAERTVAASGETASTEEKTGTGGARAETESVAASLTVGGDDGRDALIDQNTGLFSEEFFRVALESRIAAARRHLRPIAMVLLEVVEGLPQSTPKAVGPGLVADTIKATLREADTACRLRGGQFALLLEDTPENGAIWTVERIRRQLLESRPGSTMWAGIACYPAHAFSHDEIVKAADKALVAAREWRQDRIEVATAGE